MIGRVSKLVDRPSRIKRGATTPMAGLAAVLLTLLGVSAASCSERGNTSAAHKSASPPEAQPTSAPPVAVTYAPARSTQRVDASDAKTGQSPLNQIAPGLRLLAAAEVTALIPGSAVSSDVVNAGGQRALGGALGRGELFFPDGRYLRLADLAHIPGVYRLDGDAVCITVFTGSEEECRQVLVAADGALSFVRTGNDEDRRPWPVRIEPLTDEHPRPL